MDSCSGNVDCASILENKDRLRLFWENRIMADQEVKEDSLTTASSVSGELGETEGLINEDIFQDKNSFSASADVEPDSLNEEPMGRVILDAAKVLGVNEEEFKCEKGTHLDKDIIVSDNIILERAIKDELDKTINDSALDLEVRLTLEREEQLKIDHQPKNLINSPEEEAPEDFPVHHVALTPMVEESEEERDEPAMETKNKVLITPEIKVEDSENVEVKIIESNGKSEEIKSEKDEKLMLKDEKIEITKETTKQITKQITKGITKIEELVVESFRPEIQENVTTELIFETIDQLQEAEDSENGTVVKSEPLNDNVSHQNKPHIIGETLRQQQKMQQISTKSNNSLLINEFPKINKPALRTAAYDPNSDTKIALEIREMKEREEELRLLRESIVQNSQDISDNKSTKTSLSSGSLSSRHSEQGSVHSEGEHENLNGISQMKRHQNGDTILQNISLESLHQGHPYNIGYAFGHRRKENVKVKPLDDNENEERLNFKITNSESPIEREIRLVKEREEELKKEKLRLYQQLNGINGNAMKPKTLPLDFKASTNETSIQNIKIGKLNSTLNTVYGAGDTQRFLATSRIQQEIEEQTEREKGLRASGKIQTISQDRTDAKVGGSRFREVNGISSDNIFRNSTSPAPSLSDSDKSSPSPIFISGYSTNNGLVKTPSPTNSTVSAVKMNDLSSGRRFSNPQSGRNVSMQRFIASKGKDAVSAFGSISPASKERSQSYSSLSPINGLETFMNQKPSSFQVANQTAARSIAITPPAFLAKRSATAESKIQEELKEMQAREDELKKQRARLLGLSQPNLSLLDDELDNGFTTTNNEDHQPLNRLNGSKFERANSNPNLLEESDEFVTSNKKNSSFGGPRRRSMLIEQWEQRIQKSEIKSS